jgi:outer membrane immunogenic protein
VSRTGGVAIKNANGNGDCVMKRALAAAIGLAALGMAPALAADLPAQTYSKTPAWIPATYDWSGFYLGLNGGGASSRGCWTITNNAGAPVAPASQGCNTATGGFGGGQIGYRLQTGGWVYGLEFQGDWAGIKGQNDSLAVLVPAINMTRIDAFALLTGQIGYAWDKVLFYVKGGGAVTDNRYSTAFSPGGPVYNQASQARWGGAAGAGVEFSFAPDWSVAFEYDHLFIGNHNVDFEATAIAVGRSDTIGQNVDIGTVRINYRWGGPVIAKY